MKCPTCGLENRPDARFCKQCGHVLSTRQEDTHPGHSPPRPTICPACGATAKPRARFCPRCGKPLPSDLTQPSPSTADTIAGTSSIPQPDATQPSPPPVHPPARTQPMIPPPPSPSPATPERSFPRWAGWMAAIVACMCVATVIASAIAFGPRLLDGQEPAVTPTPVASPSGELPPTEPSTPVDEPTPAPTPEMATTFDAQITIAASATEVRIGDPLTITVTVTNTGQITFGGLRYQLLGTWEPFLGAPSSAVTNHPVDVPSTASDTATFILEAIQPGMAQIHANVTVDTREEPPSTRPIASEHVVEVSVID
jgi:hypothetical protein